MIINCKQENKIEPYRLTKQRKVILGEMKKMHDHPTAEEFYDRIKGKLPGIGLCTIYRNLEKFQELGLIQRIKSIPVRYDSNIQPHNHIKCIRCDKVEDVPEVIQLDVAMIEKTGYKLHAFNLEINGICKACQDHNH